MIAALTAAPTSPGTVAWKVPRPRAGIEAPVLSATRRRLAIEKTAGVLKGFGQSLLARRRRVSSRTSTGSLFQS